MIGGGSSVGRLAPRMYTIWVSLPISYPCLDKTSSAEEGSTMSNNNLSSYEQATAAIEAAKRSTSNRATHVTKQPGILSVVSETYNLTKWIIVTTVSGTSKTLKQVPKGADAVVRLHKAAMLKYDMILSGMTQEEQEEYNYTMEDMYVQDRKTWDKIQIDRNVELLTKIVNYVKENA